jgi:hypothetical protein
VSAIAIIRRLAGHAIARTLSASTSTQGRRSNRTSAHHPIGSYSFRAPVCVGGRSIATASAFQATTDSSNETLLRRILRDEPLFLESVYYPFIQHLLNEMAPSELYLTIDESSHLSDFDIFGVRLATDGLSIPLGWIVYATDEAWAEDARSLLATLADENAQNSPYHCAGRPHTEWRTLAVLLG